MKSMSIDRRQALLLGAAGLAAAGLPRMSIAQGLSGTVRVWTFLGADGQSPREVVLRDIVQRFTKDHPEVNIVIEPQPFQELEVKFVAASAQNRAPDVIWMRDTFLDLVQQRGALADLDGQLSDGFKSEVLPDLFPVFAEKSVFDGKRTSLPLWPSPAQAIFYRKDALAELGLDADNLVDVLALHHAVHWAVVNRDRVQREQLPAIRQAVAASPLLERMSLEDDAARQAMADRAALLAAIRSREYARLLQAGDPGELQRYGAAVAAEFRQEYGIDLRD